MDSRGNYSNYNNSNIRDRGDRHQRSDRERRPRDRSPGRSHSGRRNPGSPSQYRRDEPRGDNYRSNRRDVDNSQYNNKQYNNSSNSSMNNSSSNLIQSPFQNPYKIDSNTNKTTNINDPSKDRLETYAKLKKISPVKFYISIIIAVIITAALAILGIIAIKNNGLSHREVRDVTVGVAQGYLFYCGFMLLAIGTGVIAFVRKWNNLLVTYCSFLFVSCLYLCYFISDLSNVKTNCIEVMNKRWKDDFSDAVKVRIETDLECCGYYNDEDDPAETDECHKSEALKRSIIGGYYDDTPMFFNASALQKRMVAEERGCAKKIQEVVSSKMTLYIIILGVLLVLNIIAVIVTILDIKQYAEILKELSNPFA